MSQSPSLSIIIPTHNRSGLLLKSLAALNCQSCGPATFEVLVVADACEDDTAACVTDYARQAPYQLRLLSHTARSAAATRNLGAANARGETLLFLDDDVVARPELVQVHLIAQSERRIVLGYSKPLLPSKPSWYQRDARRWWEDMFQEMGRSGHRFTYRDFFSGNVSMSAALFREVHGFDTSFTGRLEDYELGLRLLKAGAQFSFAATAIGDHYDSNDLAQWLRRIRQEGVADVQIGQRHLELRTSLFSYAEPRGRWRRRLRGLAFTFPQRGDSLERLLLCQATLFEQFRLRDGWRKTVRALREYNYWRGVAAAVNGKRGLAAWLQEAPLPPVVASDAPSIDLSALPSADVLSDMLERATRLGLRLMLEGTQVMAMPPEPGAEPLRHEHLYAMLQVQVKHHFIPAQAVSLSRSMMDALSWQ